MATPFAPMFPLGVTPSPPIRPAHRSLKHNIWTVSIFSLCRDEFRKWVQRSEKMDAVNWPENVSVQVGHDQNVKLGWILNHLKIQNIRTCHNLTSLFTLQTIKKHDRKCPTGRKKRVNTPSVRQSRREPEINCRGVWHSSLVWFSLTQSGSFCLRARVKLASWWTYVEANSVQVHLSKLDVFVVLSHLTTLSQKQTIWHSPAQTDRQTDKQLLTQCSVNIKEITGTILWILLKTWIVSV